MGVVSALLAGEAPGSGWLSLEDRSQTVSQPLAGPGCASGTMFTEPTSHSAVPPAHRSRGPAPGQASWAPTPVSGGCCDRAPQPWRPEPETKVPAGGPFRGLLGRAVQVPLQLLVTAGHPWRPWACRCVTPALPPMPQDIPISVLTQRLSLPRTHWLCLIL